MLVQLSIEEVVLICSASGPVKGGVSMEGWIKKKNFTVRTRFESSVWSAKFSETNT